VVKLKKIYIRISHGTTALKTISYPDLVAGGKETSPVHGPFDLVGCCCPIVAGCESHLKPRETVLIFK